LLPAPQRRHRKIGPYNVVFCLFCRASEAGHRGPPDFSPDLFEHPSRARTTVRNLFLGSARFPVIESDDPARKLSPSRSAGRDEISSPDAIDDSEELGLQAG
jgi:hypothetical protein